MDTMQFAKSMSFQEFERKFSYLLPWEEAEKKAGRRLDSYNNFDCCLYLIYLWEQLKRSYLMEIT